MTSRVDIVRSAPGITLCVLLAGCATAPLVTLDSRPRIHGLALGDSVPTDPPPPWLKPVPAAPGWIGVFAGATDVFEVRSDDGSTSQRAWIVAPRGENNVRHLAAFTAQVWQWDPRLGQETRDELASTESGFAVWRTAVPNYHVILEPNARALGPGAHLFLAAPDDLLDARLMPALRRSPPAVDEQRFAEQVSRAKRERWPLARALPLMDEIVAAAKNPRWQGGPWFVENRLDGTVGTPGLVDTLKDQWLAEAATLPAAELATLYAQLNSKYGVHTRKLRDGTIEAFRSGVLLANLARAMVEGWIKARAKRGAPLTSLRMAMLDSPHVKSVLWPGYLGPARELKLVSPIYIVGPRDAEAGIASDLSQRLLRQLQDKGRVADLMGPVGYGNPPRDGHAVGVIIEEIDRIHSELLSETEETVRELNMDWYSWDRMRGEREFTKAYIAAAARDKQEKVLQALRETESEIESTANYTRKTKRPVRVQTTTRFLNGSGDESRRSTDVDYVDVEDEVVDQEMLARHRAALARREMLRERLSSPERAPELRPLPPEPPRQIERRVKKQVWSQAGTLTWSVRLSGVGDQAWQSELAVPADRARAPGRDSARWEIRGLFLEQVAARVRQLVLAEAPARLKKHVAGIGDPTLRTDEMRCGEELLGLR